MTTRQDGNRTNVSLPAIERKDLHILLEKYGLVTSLMEGALLCTSCATVLRDGNMGVLLVRGEVVWCSIAIPLSASKKRCISGRARQGGLTSLARCGIRVHDEFS
jgi:hypothetical protein